MAWNESSSPPAIAEYLDTCESRLRSPLSVELVKTDLEQRWQRGLRRMIEDYAVDIPELANHITPQLILEEFHARKLAGDIVAPNEYYNRFPDFARSLEQLMGVDPMLTSTTAGGQSGREIDLQPGDSIDDFDLLLVLGKGAFATVFLARQRSMQRIVAVKISADKGDEPQTLAQLDHDNIVRVYDQQSIPGRGLRLLYMQYSSGGTLSSVLESLKDSDHKNWNGRLFLRAIDRQLDARGESPPGESSVRRKLAEMSWPMVVCWLGSRLSRALDYAHRQGVLHRDLKPANVLLTSEGVPRLADFNISFSAKIEGASPVAYFGGSLAYMSPEQLEACNPRHERTADSLDGRSDLYSLGVLIRELLTGELPFPEDLDPTGQHPLLKRMTERRKRGPGTLSPISSREGQGLNSVLMRCLEPLPDDRFLTGLDLARELELCLQPAAKELLGTKSKGWRYRARQFPLVTVTTITLIPNIVAAVFNFLYNHSEIVEHFPALEPTFMRIQTIINLIAFPTGIMSARWLAGSVAKATRIDPMNQLSSTELADQRRRCLELGNVAAMVGLTLWLIAAPAYPIALHLIVGQVPIDLYIHFVASLAICGLIAAAFPFFGVTLVAVRCFYPTLVEWNSMSNQDRGYLQRLARQTWMYLALAASVPMVAIAILVIDEPDKRIALGILAAGGVFGYAIAISAFRIVQSDIVTLIKAIWADEH